MKQWNELTYEERKAFALKKGVTINGKWQSKKLIVAYQKLYKKWLKEEGNI